MSPIETAISRRRTFAIISHPDAGKTTLTEKLLLLGGAIQTAGAVKSNKIKKSATSDFMEIERQRGISVATSVMAFEYDDKVVNLLDTPGHKDFAEDTYRTLTAVDSVVLVIDCVKGVEEQTERLMEVCRMRNTPVMVFINKLDREGRDPYELLDELEEKLNIRVRPLSWPISMGSDFRGVYDLRRSELFLFEINKTKLETTGISIASLDDHALDKHVGERNARQLREDVELIEGVYEPFEDAAYRAGALAPVFFGSALNNFGVRELLEAFLELAPAPGERATSRRLVQPLEDQFSGFVFKIHANLDPRHRDRIAFLRVCSGRFERNKFFYHVRLGKNLRFANPATFLAKDKHLIEEAFPGDVIGLYDTGNFKIGDTLTEGESLYFKGIPRFSPEIFRELLNADPLKTKQLEKGIQQLTDEGVAQLFVQQPGNRKIVGTVGELQFDVIAYRLEHEYGASCRFTPVNVHKACWVTTHDQAALADFRLRKARHLALDKDQQLVYLAESAWMLESAMKAFPSLQFHFISEYDPAAIAATEEA